MRPEGSDASLHASDVVVVDKDSLALPNALSCIHGGLTHSGWKTFLLFTQTTVVARINAACSDSSTHHA
jgi:hypothetical protein